MIRIPTTLPPTGTASPSSSEPASAPRPGAAVPAGPDARPGAIAALQTLGADGKRARAPLTAARSEATRERLGRLRTELARIGPLPDTAEAARDAILAAMAHAGLEGWTVPELHEAGTQAYRDGSKRIDLISHAVTFNPWGAFRIVDLRATGAAYFELAGAGERAFVAPRDRRPAELATGRPRGTRSV